MKVDVDDWYVVRGERGRGGGRGEGRWRERERRREREGRREGKRREEGDNNTTRRYGYLKRKSDEKEDEKDAN